MGHHHHETNTTVNNNSTTNSDNVFNTVKDQTVVTNKLNQHNTFLNNDSAQGGLILGHNDSNSGTAIYKLQELGFWTTRHRLEELNWFTRGLAKAKHAAAVEAAKVHHFNQHVAAAAHAEAAKVKAGIHTFNGHVKDHVKIDIAKAKIAAGHFAQMSVASAKDIIHAATEMAKAEGIKLANQLITDAEAEGHVLDDVAKAKILALSIQVGENVSDKVGAADLKMNAMLDSHKNAFTSSIIDAIEAKGESLTLVGEEKAVALAALLGQAGEDKADALDKKIDDMMNNHRPVALVMLI